ncbi:MAG: hypothetical protein Q7K33_03755 [Candidatus Berkelbacteria bacterium]|nr:hypothetical protein [Candidatus Berkelbacteria bacterium]
MIIETITGIVVVVGVIVGLGKVSKRRKAQQLALKTRQEDELKRSLLDLRGGIWIREPNGSEHTIQNRVEQELARRSMALFNLRSSAVLTLIKDGTWSEEIASSLLDVAVIGRIKITDWEQDEWRYVSIRHVDTETGRRFDELPRDHPHARRVNSVYSSSLSPSDVFPQKYYYEPYEEFERRKEMEKQVAKGVRRQRYTLDVRFYGPEGQILGGCVANASDRDSNPLNLLVAELVNDLTSTVKPSIDAHSRNSALNELYGS